MLRCWRRGRLAAVLGPGVSLPIASPVCWQGFVFDRTVWEANRINNSAGTCASAGHISRPVVKHCPPCCAGAVEKTPWHRHRSTLRYELVRGYPAQSSTVVLSALQPHRANRATTHQPRMIVADFRSVVADANLPRNQKDIVAQKAMRERLSAYEIANIFNCMKKWNYMNEELLESLAGRMLQSPGLVKQLSPIEMSMSIQSLAVLHTRSYHPFPSFPALLAVLVRESLYRERHGTKEFEEQGITNVLYALGLIFKKGSGLEMDMESSDLLGTLLQNLTHGTRRRCLMRCTGQALSNIVYGLALIRYPRDDKLDALAEEIRQPARLNKFKEQDLTNIIYAFGLLNYRNEAVLHALCSEIAQPYRLKTIKGQGVSNIIYGLALLEFRDDFVLDALGQVIKQYGRLVQFSQQELSNILYGHGLLKYYNEEVLHAIGEEIQQTHRLKAFKEQELANIVYGLGLLGYHNEAVLEAFGGEIRQAHRLGRFKEQELTGIVYGLALLSDGWSYQVHSNYVRPVLESMAKEMSKKERSVQFTPQGLSNTAWGLAKLRFLDASLMDLLIERFLVLTNLSSGWDRRHISMLVRACGAFNIPHEKFLDFVDSWVDKNLGNMEHPQYVTNMMWGLAVLGRLSSGLFRRMCTKLIKLGPDGLKLEECGQILQAHLYGQTLATFELDAAQMSLIEKAKVVCKTEDRNATSKFEMDLSRTLGELGVAHTRQHEIVEGCMVADILVEGEPQTVIEADGPTHYTINECNGKHIPLGDTIFRNRILETLGFKVLCVPFFVWDTLSIGGRKEWLKEKLGDVQST